MDIKVRGHHINAINVVELSALISSLKIKRKFVLFVPRAVAVPKETIRASRRKTIN